MSSISKKKEINPSPANSRIEIVKKIWQGTKKQTKIAHFGERLFPNKKVLTEMPSLLAVSRSKIDRKSVAENTGVKQLKEIFRDFKNGVVHFTGPAGSGKTTLLKEICKKVEEKEYEGLRDVEIAVFLRCGDLNTAKRYYPSKLLLSYLEPELDKLELQVFEEILQYTPEKVLFILDGLDTFPDYYYSYDPPSHGKKKNVEDELLSVYNIIIELLKGHLFHGCRIITSARDMNLGHLSVTPRIFVHLLGLEDQSIYKISRHYLSPEDVREMMSMLEAHPNLKDLCRTPMFLISVLSGRISNGEFSNVSSITDNLLHLIRRFIDSQVDLMEVTDTENLKWLAFNMLKKNTINFSRKTLEMYDLTTANINSLVFESANGRNRVVFFVHQFIHEVFAALHLVGLELESFKREVQVCMELPWFSFSNLMMFRIVCNSATFKLGQRNKLLDDDDSLAAKQEFLLSMLKNKITHFHEEKYHIDVLFTLLALHECGDSANSLISENLRMINLDFEHFHSMWISDIYALMSVAAKSTLLKAFSLSRSWLSCRHLQAMCSAISNAAPRIVKLDLSGNLLTNDAMEDVGHITRSCGTEELDISASLCLQSYNPELTLSALKKALQDYKLKILKISYSKDSLKDSEMTQDTKKQIKRFVYRLEGESDPKHCLPLQRTITYPIAGKWNDASYDFVHVIRQLMVNVTEKIVVHCWKFSEEYKSLMRSACMEGISTLLIELSENDILQTAIPQSPLPDSGVVKTSDAEMEDLSFHSNIEKNNFQIMPKEGARNCFSKGHQNLQFLFHNEKSQQHAQKISVAHRTLTENDVIDIVETLSMHNQQDELELRECGLNIPIFKKLLRKIEDLKDEVKVKINKLSVTATSEIDMLIPIICEFMSSCGTTELNIEECTRTKNSLDVLSKNIKKFEVELLKLDLSYSESNISFGMNQLIFDKLTELRLANCHLQSNDFKNMMTENSKVNVLDISFNNTIDEESVRMLPSILTKDQPLTIVMEGCELTYDELLGFEEFGHTKIKRLDLSYNDTLESEGVEAIGRIARKHDIEDVVLTSCGLNKESLNPLMTGLEDHQLQSLSLSKNAGISSCPEKIAELLQKSGTVSLDLSNCKMLSSQIECLGERMKNHGHKVQFIDLSDSERKLVDTEYVNAIRKFHEDTGSEIKLALPHIDEQGKKLLQSIKL